jgi:hypothetical protein
LKTLESDEDVLSSGFGRFYVKEKGQRCGRKPATGSDSMPSQHPAHATAREEREMMTLRYHGMLIVGLLLLFAPMAVAAQEDAGPRPPTVAAAMDDAAAGIAKDLHALEICRQGLGRTLQYIQARPDLFPDSGRAATHMSTSEERRLARNAWQSFFDYCLVLDRLKQSHDDFYKSAGAELRRKRFGVFYATFLCQYRHALAFLKIAGSDPTLDIVLNEADPELGLEAKTYAAFKFRFLNVGIASQFVALNTLSAHYDGSTPAALQAAVEEDRAFIWEMGKGRGQALTLGNALRIVRDTSFSAWFPVQKGISIWMGDTKVWRMAQSLVSPEQIQSLPDQLLPGDILLERREWYLSNVGLPGFWPHVALYVGTPEERNIYFKGDDAVCGWLASQGIDDCDAERLLRRNHPLAYALSMAAQEQGHRPRIIEAVSEGVSFTTLEHSAACDSLAVLRPKLSKKERLRAIASAFQYHGRPYDFNFDSLTDTSLVCSELIYKCYEPTEDYVGLRLPIMDMMGRKLTPPNEIVRQFDREFASPSQQTDLVLFYDGHEAAGKALPAPLDAFRESWQRPKWHILLPEGAR